MFLSWHGGRLSLWGQLFKCIVANKSVQTECGEKREQKGEATGLLSASRHFKKQTKKTQCSQKCAKQLACLPLVSSLAFFSGSGSSTASCETHSDTSYSPVVLEETRWPTSRSPTGRRLASPSQRSLFFKVWNLWGTGHVTLSVLLSGGTETEERAWPRTSLESRWNEMKRYIPRGKMHWLSCLEFLICHD